jgi:hypothetical protein
MFVFISMLFKLSWRPKIMSSVKLYLSFGGQKNTENSMVAILVCSVSFSFVCQNYVFFSRSS